MGVYADNNLFYFILILYRSGKEKTLVPTSVCFDLHDVKTNGVNNNTKQYE